MRSIAAAAAASQALRAANSTRCGAVWATATSTGSSSTCSSRISVAPRRRRIPSPEPRPIRNGHGGVTSTRRSTGASRQGEAVNRA